MRSPHTTTKVARTHRNQRKPARSNEDPTQPKKKKKIKKRVANQLDTFTPVGTEVITVADAKYAPESTAIPMVNL